MDGLGNAELHDAVEGEAVRTLLQENFRRFVLSLYPERSDVVEACVARVRGGNLQLDWFGLVEEAVREIDPRQIHHLQAAGAFESVSIDSATDTDADFESVLSFESEQ